MFSLRRGTDSLILSPGYNLHEAPSQSHETFTISLCEGRRLVVSRQCVTRIPLLRRTLRVLRNKVITKKRGGEMERRPRVYRGCLNFRRDCRRYSDDGENRRCPLIPSLASYVSSFPYRSSFLQTVSSLVLLSSYMYLCVHMYICVCARVCVTFLCRVTHAFACLSLYFHFRRTLTRPLGFVFSFSLSFSLSHRIRTLLTSGPYLASFLPSFPAF